MMSDILIYLKKHGEQLDTRIAVALGISLPQVHAHIAQLAAGGEVVTCHLIRFDKGTKSEGLSCRLSGFSPKAAPGRKPALQLIST